MSNDDEECSKYRVIGCNFVDSPPINRSDEMGDFDGIDLVVVDDDI